MKVLVAGGGGYLGIPIVNDLIARGHTVAVLDRWFFGRRPEIEWSLCPSMDIRSSSVRLSPEWSVIDLAGLSNDATAEIDPTLTKSINEDGGKRLATLAKEAGVRRYLYSSSCSVYGHGTKMYLKEDDELNPLTDYARSKVAVEKHINSLSGDGFEPVILRNATAFGVSPRMRLDLAINTMTMRAWRDKRILIMGGGSQIRPFVHVKDLVNVFCKMLELPAEQVSGGTFNVGSDVMNYSISQIATIIKQNFRDAETIFVPDDADKRTYHVSFKKLRDLGIEPKFSIHYGIYEIRGALDSGTISADDPTTVTLSWYTSLLEWEKRLNDIRLDGRIL